MESSESMILNSTPWKEELRSLIHQLTSVTFSSEQDEDGETGFLTERALIYSAFVVRLLLDAGKVTDSMNGCCISVGIVPNRLENPECVQPLLRRFPEPSYYSFMNETVMSAPCRLILNQIIHSFIVPAFEINDAGAVSGFFVASDQKVNDCLYHVKTEYWVRYLDMIANDDIASIESYFNYEKGKWITAKR